MAHISSEILGFRNWIFVYCIIKKLHDKITTDYTLLLGLCRKHQDSWPISLARLVVNGKFCFLTNEQVFQELYLCLPWCFLHNLCTIYTVFTFLKRTLVIYDLTFGHKIAEIFVLKSTSIHFCSRSTYMAWSQICKERECSTNISAILSLKVKL